MLWPLKLAFRLVMRLRLVIVSVLVGMVVEVYPNRSKVRLIIDEGMQIGVLLQDERGAGIMYGRWQQGGRLTIEHVNRDVEVQLEDKIVTSTLTSGMPKGLPVGFVAGWRKDELLRFEGNWVLHIHLRRLPNEQAISDGRHHWRRGSNRGWRRGHVPGAGFQQLR